MNLEQQLLKICDAIEGKAGEIFGIEPMFSDYWLCTASDWAADDTDIDKLWIWATQYYKLGINIEHMALDKNTLRPVTPIDPLGCFTHAPIMLVALYIYLNGEMPVEK